MTPEQLTAEIMGMREEMAAQRQDLKAAFKRIDEQRELTETVHKLALCLEALTGEVKHFHSQQNIITRDVEELKAKGGKRWESIVTTIATTIVGALAGAAVLLLIKK